MVIGLMMMFERSGCRRVEVVTLAPNSFPDPVEAELYVFSGEGGIARLPLWDGDCLAVERDHVEAIWGWGEG